MRKITSTATKTCLLSAGFFLFSTICSFNSQEHKIVADVGASRVVIPSSVVFPDGVKLANTFNYLTNWQDAKMLAVGFKTNDQNDFDRWKKGVQDNCYWNGFGQLDFNKYNYIETDNKLWPATLLNVDAMVGNKNEPYSFGDLVAIYGDYRRTVIANDNADCYLTNDGNDKVIFSSRFYQSYCPQETTTADYLHKIAFGICPPYGSGGNATSNTAGDTQYSEVGWWGDEMLRIANVNETHFSNVAVAWYIGMHRLALMAASKAINDPKYWKLALHCEANALHSLTDLFSLGHAVTNRDESSFGAMKNDRLLGKDPARWMESVIRMGGGFRNANGTVSLSPNLAPNSVQISNRNDFMPSYLGLSWGVWGVFEHTYHDFFNNAGATVRNFNGDTFQVYGDFKLHNLDTASRRIIENSVTTSMQSLFNFYDAVKNNKTTATATSGNKDLFAALKYIPVFIEKDPSDYLNGMWTLYAGMVKETLQMGAMPQGWEKCRIPFLSGKDNLWPAKVTTACTTFSK